MLSRSELEPGLVVLAPPPGSVAEPGRNKRRPASMEHSIRGQSQEGSSVGVVQPQKTRRGTSSTRTQRIAREAMRQHAMSGGVREEGVWRRRSELAGLLDGAAASSSAPSSRPILMPVMRQRWHFARSRQAVCKEAEAFRSIGQAVRATHSHKGAPANPW